MSFWDVLEPRKTKPREESFTAIQPSGRLDVAEVTGEVFWQKERITSEQENRARRYREREDLYEQMAGQRKKKTNAPRLIEDASEMFPELMENWQRETSRNYVPYFEIQGEQENVLSSKQIQEKIDAYILKKRESDPNFKKILTQQEMEAKTQQETDDLLQRQREVMAGAPKGLTTAAFAIGGAIPAAVSDPVNLATALIPTPAKFARAGFFGEVAFNAFVDAGVEFVSYPVVSDYNRRLGVEYGLTDLAMNVGGAVAGGATLRALGVGVGAVASKAGEIVPAGSYFRNLADKFKMIGDTRTADELEVMGRGADASDIDLGRRGVIDPETNRRALKETDDAWREGRPLDPENLPRERDLLDEQKIKASGDPQFQAAARGFKDQKAKLGQEELPPSKAEVDEGKYDLSDEEAIRQELEMSRNPEFQKNRVADLEAWNKENPDQIYYDGNGKEITFDQFKKNIEDSEGLQEAIRVCGAL